MNTSVPVNSDERYDDASGLSLMAISQYYRELAWVERLSDEEQETLLRRVARAQRDPKNAHYALLARDARDRLVEQFQPLVLGIARRQVGLFESMELLDLVNEGSLGLLEAIERYSRCSTLQGRFSVLATICVRQALWLARCRLDGLVRLPQNIQDLLLKIKKASCQYECTHGGFPSDAQLAQCLDVSQDQILEAKFYGAHQHPACLGTLSFEGEQAEEFHGFTSLFQSFVASDNERQVERRKAIHQVCEQVLTERERDVITVRYGFGEQVYARTEKETGNVLGLASTTVDSLYNRAVARLRSALEPLVSDEQGIEKVQTQFSQEYYDVKEVAELLDLSLSGVLLYAKQGRLPSCRGIRCGGRASRILFPKEAVHELMARRTEQVSA